MFRKLEKHRGCVNTVSFNADGDIIVSGSDDRRVILWDWQSGQTKLSFHSGHSNNVFQAKIMPHSDDRSIVTCAADGQVYLLPLCCHHLSELTGLVHFPFIFCQIIIRLISPILIFLLTNNAKCLVHVLFPGFKRYCLVSGWYICLPILFISFEVKKNIIFYYVTLMHESSQSLLLKEGCFIVQTLNFR